MPTSLPMCREPWPVLGDGVRVGQVTSVAMSPRLECGVALGMLDASHWHPETEVQVVTPDGVFFAAVCELPFDDVAVGRVEVRRARASADRDDRRSVVE